MSLELDVAFARATELIQDKDKFVRAVLSGRRRNMQTAYERIDIRRNYYGNTIDANIMRKRVANV